MVAGVNFNRDVGMQLGSLSAPKILDFSQQINMCDREKSS